MNSIFSRKRVQNNNLPSETSEPVGGLISFILVSALDKFKDSVADSNSFKEEDLDFIDILLFQVYLS